MINTIIFDIGGVLIDWNPKYLYRKIFDSEEEMNHFLAEICHPEWNAQQDAGNSLKSATLERIQKFPQFESQIRAYYDRWSEMLGGAIEPTVSILDHYVRHTNYRVLALSNWSKETFPTTMQLFPFLGWFEGIVVSGSEKLKKPDPRIYQVLCDRFSVNPLESVFIDDSYPNVAVASTLGFTSIHYKDSEQLQSELLEVLNQAG